MANNKGITLAVIIAVRSELGLTRLYRIDGGDEEDPSIVYLEGLDTNYEPTERYLNLPRHQLQAALDEAQERAKYIEPD